MTKAILALAFAASAVAAQPAWPAPSPYRDRFGGDTRVNSAFPGRYRSYSGKLTAAPTATTITDANASFPVDGSLIGKYLNPNLGRGDSGNQTMAERWFRVVSNTATTVSVDPADGSILATSFDIDLSDFFGRSGHEILPYAPPAVGSSYLILAPFSVELIGSRYWFIDPDGYGFWPRGLAKLSDSDGDYSHAVSFGGVYLQNASGAFSTYSLPLRALDTHASDVVDNRGVTMSAVGDAIYFGSERPFGKTGFYMTKLGVGGKIAWSYWTGTAWAPVNKTGNPASQSGVHADATDKSFNLDIGAYQTNGQQTGSPANNQASNGSMVQWWTSGLPASDWATTALPPDSTPRYYVRGVVTQSFGTAPVLGRLFNAASHDSSSLLKYGSDKRKWFDAQNKRMDDWGFSSIGQYGGRYTTLDGFYSADFSRKPVEPTTQFSGYTVRDDYPYHIRSIYTFATCYNKTRSLYNLGTHPDVFDPAYVKAVEDLAAKYVAGMNSPWAFLLMPDEADYLFAINNPAHDHVGWISLTQSPYRSVSSGGYPYSDTKLYAKYALRDMLRYRYRDPSETLEQPTADSVYPIASYSYSDSPTGAEAAALQRLNAAWGTKYTTWTSTASPAATASLNEAPDGTRVSFTATLGAKVSWVELYLGSTLAARDNNAGAFVAAGYPNDVIALASGSSVNYATGAATVVFASAPAAGTAFGVRYQSGGYKYGTGFMDESGHNIAMGCSAVATDTNASGAKPLDKPGYPAVRSDLDGFLSLLAEKTEKTVYQAVKKRTLSLVTTPLYVPPPVVAAAIQPYVDVQWAKPSSQSDIVALYNLMRKPIYIADYETGNLDSPMNFAGGTVTSVSYSSSTGLTTIAFSGGAGYNLANNFGVQFPESNCPSALSKIVVSSEWDRVAVKSNLTTCVKVGQRIVARLNARDDLAPNAPLETQGDRASAISAILDYAVAAQGDDGIFPVVGWEHWAFPDDSAFYYRDGAVAANFGFVSTLDNAYDGYEAMKATAKDANGRFVGGEDRDYGDLIGPLSVYLHSLYDKLVDAPSLSHAKIESFTAVPASGGSTVIVNWTTTNAAYASISAIGAVSNDGGHTFHVVTAPSTYTLTAMGTDNIKVTRTLTVPADAVPARRRP